MPTYEYRCPKCYHIKEIFHGMSEVVLVVCPKCMHGPMQKGPGGGSAIHFTGSGFYQTDYKGK